MKPIFDSLSRTLRQRRRVVALVAVLLLAGAVFGAMRIGMATGTETFLPSDSQAYQDYERFNEHFGSTVIVVMVSGDCLDTILSPVNLQAMDSIESRMAAHEDVMSAIGPAYLVREACERSTGSTALPADAASAVAMVTNADTGGIRSEFQGVLPDPCHALIPVVCEGIYYTGDEAKELVDETEGVVQSAGFQNAEVAVTGIPAFTSQIKDMMTRNMGIMFGVALLLMLVILIFVFRVRGRFAWRWLPLGGVGIAVIYTFGATGLLSIPITMVSMSAFPILIGLGVDYSIQLHCRYDEETREGSSPSEAVASSLRNVGPSIGIAVVAVCLSFVAMLFSPVPMIKDFGIMLLIGVVACYLVALFLPLAVLSWRDRRSVSTSGLEKGRDEPEEAHDGLIERGLRRIAPWVIGHPAVIIPIAVVIAVLGLVLDSRIVTETDETKMISESVPAMRDYQTLKDVMYGASTLNVPLNALIEADDVTRPDVVAWLLQVQEQVGTQLSDKVGDTNSLADLVLQANGGEIPDTGDGIRALLEGFPEVVKGNAVSEDYRAANLAVGLLIPSEAEAGVEIVREVRSSLAELAGAPPEGVAVAVTGARALSVDMFDAFSSGRQRMTLASVALIFVALLLLFRFNLAMAVLATLPIALMIGWSSGIMYVSGIKYAPLTSCLGALILGIGVEYTVLLLMRYREERLGGQAPTEAMTTAMTRIGRAVLASGLTTIGGFAALLAASDFLILRDFGVMTVIAVSLSLLGTLVLLPPLAVSLDSVLERRPLATAVALLGIRRNNNGDEGEG